MLEIYTDGAFSPLRETGGIGIVFVKDGNKIYEYSKTVHNTTNNRCEIGAVIYALNAVSKPIDSIIVYSDSQYVIGCITKGWKRKKNIELWNLFDKVLSKVDKLCPNITFCWVKGHAENKFNNLADKLAQEASQVI